MTGNQHCVFWCYQGEQWSISPPEALCWDTRRDTAGLRRWGTCQPVRAHRTHTHTQTRSHAPNTCISDWNHLFHTHRTCSYTRTLKPLHNINTYSRFIWKSSYVKLPCCWRCHTNSVAFRYQSPAYRKILQTWRKHCISSDSHCVRLWTSISYIIKFQKSFFLSQKNLF